MSLKTSALSRGSLILVVRAALAWWLSELAGLVPNRLKRIGRSRRSDFTALIERNSWIIRTPGQPDDCFEPRPSVAFDTALGRFKTRRSPVAATLLLPIDRCFVRHTDLPKPMLGQAQAILLGELEGNTPFTADEVHWDWFTTGPAGEPGAVAVTQVVIKRRDLAAIRQALTAAGVAIAAIAVEGGNGLGASIRLPLDLQRNDTAGNETNTPGLDRARHVVIAAAVLAGLAIVPAAFMRQSNTEAALDTAIAEARDSLAARPGAGRGQLKDLGDDLAMKRGTPPITRILTELETLLPPDTFLEQTFLEKGVMTLQGRTGSTGSLERALAKSRLFDVGHNTAPADNQVPMPFAIRVKLRPSPREEAGS